MALWSMDPSSATVTIPMELSMLFAFNAFAPSPLKDGNLILRLRRFAEVTHLCSSEVTLARNGTASSHAVGVAAWFRTSVEGEARGGKSIDIAVSSRAVGAVGFCL